MNKFAYVALGVIVFPILAACTMVWNSKDVRISDAPDAGIVNTKHIGDTDAEVEDDDE